MQIQAIIKGAAVGLAAGTVGYFVSTAARSDKSKLKRRTVRAVHAVGSVMDSIADMMR